MKGDEQRPYVDGISVDELDGRGEPLAAEPSPVLAAKILEHRACRHHHEPRVPARHRGSVKPDVHIGIASDNVFADR